MKVTLKLNQPKLFLQEEIQKETLSDRYNSSNSYDGRIVCGKNLFYNNYSETASIDIMNSKRHGDFNFVISTNVSS